MQTKLKTEGGCQATRAKMCTEENFDLNQTKSSPNSCIGLSLKGTTIYTVRKYNEFNSHLI